VDPILFKQHYTKENPVPLVDRSGSIVGGHVYRGPSPELNGLYFYADSAARVMWLAKQENNVWIDERWLYGDPFLITSFGEDEAGNLYVSDIEGPLYRIDGPLPDFIFADGFDLQ